MRTCRWPKEPSRSGARGDPGAKEVPARSVSPAQPATKGSGVARQRQLSMRSRWPTVCLTARCGGAGIWALVRRVMLCSIFRSCFLPSKTPSRTCRSIAQHLPMAASVAPKMTARDDRRVSRGCTKIPLLQAADERNSKLSAKSRRATDVSPRARPTKVERAAAHAHGDAFVGSACLLAGSRACRGGFQDKRHRGTTT